jgi:formylmethanofuran dehydrogenase subunit E
MPEPYATYYKTVWNQFYTMDEERKFTPGWQSTPWVEERLRIKCSECNESIDSHFFATDEGEPLCPDCKEKADAE